MPIPEGSRGLIIGLLFSAINFSVIAQVNIKGFYNSEKYPSAENFPSVYISDLNQDGIEDVLLYGSESKNLATHLTLENNQLSDVSTKFFFYPVTKVEKLDRKKKATRHFFISRTKRIGGIITFTQYGNPHLLKQISFDSYPENISVGNTNNNGNRDVVVSGINFRGLELVEEDGYKLVSKKLFERRIFSDAVFFDFDQDGLDDIIAVDIQNSTLAFLYNDQNNGFSEERNIVINTLPEKLFIADYNNDGFKDIILANEKNVSVMMGDSVYSFSKEIYFSKNENDKALLFTDINYDGNTDYIASSSSLNTTGIYYATESNQFNRVKYTDTYITDVGIIGNKKNKSLIAKDDSSIYKIAKVNNIENLNITINDNVYLPEIVQKSPQNTYLAYIDSANYSLTLLKNSNNRIAENIYSASIPYNFNNLCIDEFDNSIYVLLYTPGTTDAGLVGLQNSTTDNYNNETNLLNTNFSIVGGSIFRNIYEDKQYAFFTTMRNDSLFFESFNLTGEPVHNLAFIDDNVLSAKQNFISGFDILYYSTGDSTLIANSYDIATKESKKRIVDEKEFSLYSLKKSFSGKLNGEFFTFTFAEGKDSIIYIHSNETVKTVKYYNPELTTLLELMDIQTYSTFSQKNSLHLMHNYTRLYNLSINNLIKKREYFKGIETEPFNDYFAVWINKNWHIVYKSENTIKTMVLNEN